MKASFFPLTDWFVIRRQTLLTSLWLKKKLQNDMTGWTWKKLSNKIFSFLSTFFTQKEKMYTNKLTNYNTPGNSMLFTFVNVVNDFDIIFYGRCDATEKKITHVRSALAFHTIRTKTEHWHCATNDKMK